MRIGTKSSFNPQSKSNYGLQKLLNNRQALQKKMSKLKTEQGNPKVKQKQLKKIEKQIASLDKEIQKSRADEKKKTEKKNSSKVDTQMQTQGASTTEESELLNKTAKVIMSSSEAVNDVKKLGRAKKKLLKLKKKTTDNDKTEINKDTKTNEASKKVKEKIDAQLKLVKEQIEDKNKGLAKGEKVHQYKKQMVLKDKL